MSLKKKYKEGEVVYLKAPPQASTQNGISIGKCYRGVVKDVSDFLLGVIIFDDYSRERYTCTHRSFLLNSESDWIILDPYLENLRKVLE